jgi:hypothetical protein
MPLPFLLFQPGIPARRSFGKHRSGRTVSIQSVIAKHIFHILSVTHPSQNPMPSRNSRQGCALEILPAISSPFHFDAYIYAINMPKAAQIRAEQNKMEMPLFYAALRTQAMLPAIRFDSIASEILHSNC